MTIGEIEQKTIIRFKNIDDFETYINAIDNGGYFSEDVIFTGWLYKLNTLEFNKVNRSQNARGTNFKQDNVEYIGNNCWNKNKTNKHVHWHRYGKLKAHQESVPLRVSTAGIILFKNCAFGDYPPTACKI